MQSHFRFITVAASTCPTSPELLHKSQEDVQDAMLTQELAYINPVTGLVEERSEYLSGNVRDKLLQAEQANENGLFNAQHPRIVEDHPAGRSVTADKNFAG